ncbi:MAG: hypothetical protein O7F08_06025, partial [Deltaproteobacteria bacterium]|nr:hypothetical protein [Deltaproteobacteria bacterium]
MPLLTPLLALAASLIVSAIAVPAGAEPYDGSDGYAQETTPDIETVVGRDGYVRDDVTVEDDPTNYIVIEQEQGTTQQIDGDTVIVVEEPQPIAASEEAPPPPQTVVVEQPVAPYDGAIWVDGYWYYGAGGYVWVDGHYVAPRPNYVFVHPRWDYYSSVWYFVPGYYRPYSVWISFGYYRPFFFFGPYFYPFYFHPLHHYHHYYGPHGGGRYSYPNSRGYPARSTTARETGRGGLS